MRQVPACFDELFALIWGKAIVKTASCSDVGLVPVCFDDKRFVRYVSAAVCVNRTCKTS